MTTDMFQMFCQKFQKGCCLEHPVTHAVTITVIIRYFEQPREYTLSEAVVRCSVKTVFLENSQNLQENTCARVSGTGVFLRDFLKEHLWWLLLHFIQYKSER